MDINKTHQIIIFNPLDIKDNFSKLLLIVFKENPESIKKFLTQEPSYWYSESYPLEIAEVFRHKLIRMSNDLKLNIVIKLQKVKKG